MIPFDPAQFKIDYPQFANVSDSKLTAMFNTPAKQLGQPVITIVDTDEDRYYWQCVVLAHLLTLEELGLTGTPQSFGQGTDSGSLYINLPQWANWWGQSPYGQQCYQMIYTYQAGGHYISDGAVPYLGNAMNGQYDSVGWY